MENQEIKLNLEQWLKELIEKSDGYDQKVESLEKEIRLLRIRNHVLDNTTMVMQFSDNITEGFVSSEKEKNLQVIKEKEAELQNLQEVEWKNIYQVRKLIDNVNREISKLQ